MSQHDRESGRSRPWERDRGFRDREYRDQRRDREHGRDYRGYQYHDRRDNRDQRFGRADRRVAREVSIEEGELKPMPNGKQCNPLCPYFKCGKKAISVVRRDIGGSIKFAAFCNWVNDLCIGGVCQFASCEKFYLLPDGSCLYAVGRERRSSGDDMLKELEREEEKAKRLKGLISKKLGGKDFDLE
ncbi:MAG: hypothetical protein QXI22_08050 [Sulfolobales archaeon]